MATASGILKQVNYKAEVSFGTIPVAAAAQMLRRVTSSLDLNKDTYQSNEIRADYQLADFRHGVRRVSGTINGELSAKTYGDFMQAVLKKDFTAGVTTAGMSITIAGVAGAYTLTRSAGSWIADGFKIGDIIQLSVGVFNAANISKNLMITALAVGSPTIITVLVVNGTAMVNEGPIASATATVMNKKTFTPLTGHTDKSFSIEHWFPDVPTSEVYSGCKVSKFAINLPATGMATVAIDFMGQNVTTNAAQYFTSPTAVTTTGNMAAVNGVVRVNGVTALNITGMTLTIDCGQSGEPAVGSNTIAALIAQRVIVTGQFSGTLVDGTLRDVFINETEISLSAVFTADNTAASPFVAFTIPRLKLSDANHDDGEKTIVVTYQFQALMNINGGAGTATDQSTLIVQDSAV